MQECEAHNDIIQRVAVLEESRDGIQRANRTAWRKIDRLDTAVRKIEQRIYLIVGGLILLGYLAKPLLDRLLPAAQAALD